MHLNKMDQSGNHRAWSSLYIEEPRVKFERSWLCCGGHEPNYVHCAWPANTGACLGAVQVSAGAAGLEMCACIHQRTATERA
jgi:hypothetical protein